MDEGDRQDYFDLLASPGMRKRPFPYSPPASNASGYDPCETDDTDSNLGGRNSAGTGPCWKHARQNHSQIEKRRRDKMNMHINELATLVPMCSAMAKKLDKLTVLRMVVQYVKTVRGAVHSYTEGTYKPSFVTDAELRSLLLKITDGFVFVVSCDRGRLLFVSESVSSVLGYQRNELLGQSWFDLLHPKDIQKMKEQLASSDLSPRERYIDSKTMLPVKTSLGAGHRGQTSEGLCPGARRAFFCRMRVKESDDKLSRHQKRFNVIRCIGYLKSWTPMDDEESGGNLSCLVAVGRAMPAASPTNLPPPLRADVPTTSISSFQLFQQQNSQTGLSFSSRHSVDGKYVYVDPGITYIFGYLPQEVVGLNLTDFLHPDDALALADIHRRALGNVSGVMSPTYRFKTKEGSYQLLQTHFKAFRNPWTKETEFIVARNFIPLRGATSIKQDIDHPCAMTTGMSDVSPEGCSSMQTPGPSLCVSSSLPTVDTPSTGVLGSSRLSEIPQLALCAAGDISSDCGGGSVVSDGGAGSTASAGTTATVTAPPGVDFGVTAGDSDGNDEAAMAVIMRLLEVDAGLGGPVDYSGLPWPLT